MTSRIALRNWSLRNRLILAVLAMTAVAIAGSDFAAESALKTFLVQQVDNQLDNVAGGSILRLDRAGIDPNSGGDDGTPFRPVRPLRNVPSSTTITLLDIQGNVVGHLGGELENGNAQNLFKGFTPSVVIAHQAKPFTINQGEHQFRALARILPSGLGSVVVSISLDSVTRTSHELTALFLLISIIVLAAIALLGWSLIRLSLRPLSKIEETAEAIAEGDLSARLEEGNPKTEVGRLTKSLNTMLGRIEESFAVRIESESKLRRFVADASHELRTPLTAIRGFAELHRQGAVQGEEKTKELIGRIEKESIRMGSLVEDLLLLARLDQSREMAQDPVDLHHLIIEAVASARAAGPDHPITMDLENDDAYVLGDSMRIYQAISNLLANARTHTPKGTSITVSLHSTETERIVTVSDTGPGLSKEDQEKIFERFYRADPARVRTGSDGSGLGLSIVDAVMKAHGGSVEVSSELGHGASFTLHFPIKAD